jgi:hypothetical protein
MHVLKLLPDWLLKLNADGKAKDRLCMRGDMCPRVPGVPTYSPCVEWPVFLIFCAVAVAYGAAMVQCDVVNAFVQALLSDHPGIPHTYMPVPQHTRHIYQAHLPGFRPDHEYVRVLRALYGLPESSYLFHAHLHLILLGLGFRLLGGEPCIYVKCYPERKLLLIALHVDDFMMANCGCTDLAFEHAWEGIRTDLHGYLKTAGPQEFLGTDIALSRVGTEEGPNTGVDFTRGTGGMHVSCGTHISEACARLLPFAPPIHTDPRVPMSTTHYALMSRREGRPLAADDAGVAWYKEVVWSCTWFASRARLDVAFAVHYLARFLNTPTVVHLHAAAHLLLYLQATHTHSISFRTGGREDGSEDSIVVYHDATFTADPHDSSFVCGVVVFLRGAPIFWHASRVAYVTRSSTDAEMWGCDDALHYVETVLPLLTDLAVVFDVMRPLLDLPYPIRTDNSALVEIVESVDDKVNRTLQHILSRIQHLLQAVRDRLIRSEWTPKEKVLADILTKWMHAPSFLPFRDQLVVAALIGASAA